MVEEEISKKSSSNVEHENIFKSKFREKIRKHLSKEQKIVQQKKGLYDKFHV